jgi:predicted metalloprotease with PDZ domain
VLLRLGNMRGVDLDVFDFDYDLTWMAFFLSADGKVYGRYGGRSPESASKYLSRAGLRHAADAALAAHRREPPAADAEAPRKPRTAEQYPAAARLTPGACIHCHNVYEFRREALQAAEKWKLDEVWVYPLPENLGLTLDVDRGARVRAVAAGSAAARLGLAAGDTLRAVDGRPVASFADVQYALHRAPARGSIPVAWERAGQARHGRLDLPEGWRQTDLSWRWSLRGLQPEPCVDGEDLTPQEKQRLGLDAKQLAFRQGPFVTPPARHAGVQINDVIVGVDGRRLEMTARQFGVYVRLNYRPGDRVRLNVLRAGKRLDLTLKLPG